jgi:hypothetical protein
VDCPVDAQTVASARTSLGRTTPGGSLEQQLPQTGGGRLGGAGPLRRLSTKPMSCAGTRGGERRRSDSDLAWALHSLVAWCSVVRALAQSTVDRRAVVSRSRQPSQLRDAVYHAVGLVRRKGQALRNVLAAAS